MDMSWIIALITVYSLPLHQNLVTAQFGIYFDSNLRNYKYFQSLQCIVNNFYFQGYTNIRIPYYTTRNDVNCCYLAGTRNKCCEQSGYNLLTRRFTKVCKCDPTVRCGQGVVTPPPTTTIPTTTPTTTPPPRPTNLFCPVLGPRILNSIPVPDRCGAYPGVFPVVRGNQGNNIAPLTICNAVLASAYVQGVRKTTLVTSQFCRQISDAALSISSDIYIQVGPTLLIPYSRFTKVTGRDGAAFFDMDVNTLQQLTSVCTKAACGLSISSPNMIGSINYSDCKVLSYGSYEANQLSQSGLRSINVRIFPQGCRNIPALSATNTLCFTTTDQVPIMCSGDYGAPVFCKSYTTGENIVVGVAAGTGECGRVNSLAVVQWPTF